MINRFILLTIFACALALTACNGGGTTNPPAPGPTCSPPSGTQYALVYPAPNSTAIPDAFGQIIVGANPALPSSWDAVVTTTVTLPAYGGTFQTASPPFPTPNATPSFANPAYQSSSFTGTGLSQVVYSVYLNNKNSNCTPLGPIGSFTTR